MSNTTNVFINGDRTLFKSKNSVNRLKKELRVMADPTKVESSLFVNDTAQLKVSVNENNITVDIVDKKEYEREMRKRMLRNRIRQGQKQRSGEMTQQMKSMKRTVPKNLFNSYKKAMAGFNFPLPSPTEVIKNPDKYKNQISLMMSQMGKVSNDVNASGAIKNYFKQLGNYLDIEPANMSMEAQEPEMAPMVRVDDDTEDEDDEVPQLI